jgi:hypothetical protein
MKLTPTRKPDILTEDMLAKLSSQITPLLKFHPWEVIFGITQDGVSLHTFYDLTKNYNPTIIVVKDSHNRVFGAFASEPWHSSMHFYGTGESFLFAFQVALMANHSRVMVVFGRIDGRERTR